MKKIKEIEEMISNEWCTNVKKVKSTYLPTRDKVKGDKVKNKDHKRCEMRKYEKNI